MSQLKVRLRRVKMLDEESKAIHPDGFVHGVIPDDGFIVFFDGSTSVPLYVRDKDLLKAKEMRDRKNKPISVLADSWEGGVV